MNFQNQWEKTGGRWLFKKNKVLEKLRDFFRKNGIDV